MNELVDEIILINLPGRNERLHSAKQELMRNGITKFNVWPATQKENGAEGLFLTMMDVFKYCYASKFKRVAILEDDIKFLLNPTFIVKKCLENLGEGYWHMLHLGPNTQQPFEQWETRYMLPLQNGLATHAIIYSQDFISEIYYQIDSGKLVWTGKPFDVVLAELIEKRSLNAFCTYPLLATQKDDYSDIEKTHVSYNHIENKFYKNVAHLLNR